MVPAFEEAAFKLTKKDEISPDPVKTEFGFHIIKLIDRKGKVDSSYENFVKDLQKKVRIWSVLK